MIERAALDGGYARPAEPGWRGTDWPAHERDVPIAGRRVHYLDAGEGERAFVLVHGMGGRWQHWLETIPARGRARPHRPAGRHGGAGLRPARRAHGGARGLGAHADARASRGLQRPARSLRRRSGVSDQLRVATVQLEPRLGDVARDRVAA